MAFTEGDGVGRLTEVDPVSLKPLISDRLSDRNGCIPGKGINSEVSLFNAQRNINLWRQ
jgi:hypothetical protein